MGRRLVAASCVFRDRRADALRRAVYPAPRLVRGRSFAASGRGPSSQRLVLRDGAVEPGACWGRERTTPGQGRGARSAPRLAEPAPGRLSRSIRSPPCFRSAYWLGCFSGSRKTCRTGSRRAPNGPGRGQKALDAQYAPKPSWLNRVARHGRVVTATVWRYCRSLIVHVLGISIGLLTLPPLILFGLWRMLFKPRKWLARSRPAPRRYVPRVDSAVSGAPAHAVPAEGPRMS